MLFQSHNFIYHTLLWSRCVPVSYLTARPVFHVCLDLGNGKEIDLSLSLS